MKVAVVVEPRYDGLALLVSRMPVWIVDSTENKSSATKIWAQKADGVSTDLTTFDVQDVSQRTQNCLNILDAIELHHPEMTELLIVGIDDVQSLRKGLLDLGYSLESTEDVLIARKLLT
jgi:hypothetical protein